MCTQSHLVETELFVAIAHCLGLARLEQLDESIKSAFLLAWRAAIQLLQDDDEEVRLEMSKVVNSLVSQEVGRD